MNHNSFLLSDLGQRCRELNNHDVRGHNDIVKITLFLNITAY